LDVVHEGEVNPDGDVSVDDCLEEIMNSGLRIVIRIDILVFIWVGIQRKFFMKKKLIFMVKSQKIRWDMSFNYSP
jgi:hypothetical protein